MGKGSKKKSGRVNPREEMNPSPLIFVSKAYIPNLGPLGPPIVTGDTYPGGWVGGWGWLVNCDYIA